MPAPFLSGEGMILQAFPYRDHDQILTVFTPDRGVVKVFFHGSRSRRRAVQGSCLPLALVEMTYREQSGELYNGKEIKLIDLHDRIRKEGLFLDVACDLLQAVYFSQRPGKPAPLLYRLLCAYLSRIPSIPDPRALASSFRLKILKHEGLSPFPFICSHCRDPLFADGYLSGADWYCRLHRKEGADYWDEEEIGLAYLLASSKAYRELALCTVSPEFRLKTDTFFKDCVSH